MKVNGIDARKYNAKQLTAEVLPPSLAVDYEIVTSAILPTEFETDMELGQLKLCMYFRGKDRNSLIRSMSAFWKISRSQALLKSMATKESLRHIQQAAAIQNESETRYQLNITLEGYF